MKIGGVSMRWKNARGWLAGKTNHSQLSLLVPRWWAEVGGHFKRATKRVSDPI